MLGFLEEKGIESYKMQVEPEAYQIRHNGQIIRFYVHRNKMGCPKSTGRVSGG